MTVPGQAEVGEPPHSALLRVLPACPFCPWGGPGEREVSATLWLAITKLSNFVVLIGPTACRAKRSSVLLSAQGV